MSSCDRTRLIVDKLRNRGFGLLILACLVWITESDGSILYPVLFYWVIEIL